MEIAKLDTCPGTVMAINGNNVLVQRKFTCPKQQRTHKDLCLALTKVKLSKLFDPIFF